MKDSFEAVRLGIWGSEFPTVTLKFDKKGGNKNNRDLLKLPLAHVYRPYLCFTWHDDSTLREHFYYARLRSVIAQFPLISTMYCT